MKVVRILSGRELKVWVSREIRRNKAPRQEGGCCTWGPNGRQWVCPAEGGNVTGRKSGEAGKMA